MNQILETHRIPAQALRANDFEAFYQQRKQALLALIEAVMGKQAIVGQDPKDEEEEEAHD
jgi:hypothetical protein